MKFLTEFTISSNSFGDSVGDGAGSLYTIDSNNRLRVYDLDSLSQEESYALITSAPRGLALVTAASAVIGTSASYELMELSSGYSQTYSGAAATPATPRGQVMAGNTATKIVLGCQIANSNLSKFDGNTFTASQISPAPLSGVRGSCIITREATSTWILGTVDGKIHELNSSGTVSKTITLPTTPNAGVAPTHAVMSLALLDDILYVSTSTGFVFVYTYSTSTLIDKKVVPTSTSTTTTGGMLFSHPSSGVVYSIPNISQTDGVLMSAINVAASSVCVEDSVFITATAKPTAIGFDYSLDRGWVVFPSFIRIFESISASVSAVQTLIQDPVGVDIAGRIVRLRDPGVGKAFVASDQSISAEETTINSRDSASYIEIAIDSGFDVGVRRFTI